MYGTIAVLTARDGDHRAEVARAVASIIDDLSRALELVIVTSSPALQMNPRW
jgi:hypothetical protein